MGPGRWVRAAGAVMVALLAGACTYGPSQERVRIEQVMAVPDSYRAHVVVSHEVFHPPTGLSAFPDGGRAKFVTRRIRHYVVDSEARTVRELMTHEASDSVWESYGGGVTGLVDDDVSYLTVHGCPRGGECYPPLTNFRVYRVPLTGAIQRVDEMPAGVGLPGGSLAPHVGEVRYVRYSISSGTVTARFEDDGPFEPVFEAHPLGELRPVQR